MLRTFCAPHNISADRSQVCTRPTVDGSESSWRQAKCWCSSVCVLCRSATLCSCTYVLYSNSLCSAERRRLFVYERAWRGVGGRQGRGGRLNGETASMPLAMFAVRVTAIASSRLGLDLRVAAILSPPPSPLRSRRRQILEII